jgi:hypothetical protein
MLDIRKPEKFLVLCVEEELSAKVVTVLGGWLLATSLPTPRRP